AILASLILWPLYVGVALTLQLVGLVLLVPLCLFRMWSWRRSYVAQFRPRGPIAAGWGGWLTWLWGNEEDGVNGPMWWAERTRAYDGGRLRLAWSAYRWSALRNPVNNLRFVPGINPVIDPARVRHWREGRWAFTWQGLYAGFMWFPVIRGRTF